MGFSGRDSSCDSVKRRSSPSLRKKKNASNPKEDDLCMLRSSGARNGGSTKLHTARTGLARLPRKKVAPVFPRPSVEEDVDLEKQFDKERCFDDKECTWLSSDCESPSSFFEEYRLSSAIYHDKWLVSWLSSLADAYICLDDRVTLFSGSQANSIDQTPLALERANANADKILLEELKEREVVNKLLNSTWSDSIESCLTCSKSCEDSISCDSYSTPLSINLESSSQTSDSDRESFRVSLLNLDGEDSKWISDRESELDYFQSGFSRPSFRSSWGSEVLSSNSSSSSLTELNLSSEHVSKAVDSENLNAEEPLFWPFERKFDWSSEKTWDCFSMSPRKDSKIFGARKGNPSRFNEPKLPGKKTGLKEGCRTRLMSGSGSKSSNLLESKQKNDKKGVGRSNTTPSRLSKLSKSSMKIVPLQVKENMVEPKDDNTPSKMSVAVDGSLLEEDFESIEELASIEEVPIETLLGLHEFDGHEGVDSEFNGTTFSLDETL